MAGFPSGARLVVVADPDRLLADEAILDFLRARGYSVLPFEDPVAFRYDYEVGYRRYWDAGQDAPTALVVAVAGPLGDLPFDVFRAGRSFTVSLGALFPRLSQRILAALNRADLDRLTAPAQRLSAPQGDNATIELVYRSVYDLEVDQLREVADLLAFLVRLHGADKKLPPLLAAWLIARLRQIPTFEAWPLEGLLADRTTFVAFLQDRWPAFLDRLAQSRQVREKRGASPPAVAPDLPFADARVRPYVATWFLDGTLQPLTGLLASESPYGWAAVGIRRNPVARDRERLAALLDALANSIPTATAQYGDWFPVARRWAEILVLRYAGSTAGLAPLFERFEALRADLAAAFSAWLAQRYGSLYNQPALPVLVHHIPHALVQYRHRHANRKIALLVLDGLALAGWVIVRDHLRSRRADLAFDESAAFAWIPTITSVSRQAIFSGRLPVHFAGSIDRTDTEPTLWRHFWGNRGVKPPEIDYRVLPRDDAAALREIDQILGQPALQVLGLVVSIPDRIADSAVVGMAGVHAVLRTWLEASGFEQLLDRLALADFDVFLTADHGNIESVGIGSPQEGAIAEQTGRRVRIYQHEALRAQVHARFPDSLSWPALGLPPDYFPLLATGQRAFTKTGETIVAHGGASLDEVIVPYVQVRRRVQLNSESG
jgi:hypothetical protein